MEGGGEGEGVAGDRQRLLVVRKDLPLDGNRVMTKGLSSRLYWIVNDHFRGGDFIIQV